MLHKYVDKQLILRNFLVFSDHIWYILAYLHSQQKRLPERVCHEAQVDGEACRKALLVTAVKGPRDLLGSVPRPSRPDDHGQRSQVLERSVPSGWQIAQDHARRHPQASPRSGSRHFEPSRLEGDDPAAAKK